VGPRTESPFARGCRAAIEVARTHLQMRNRVRMFPYGDGVVEDPHPDRSRQMRGILDLIVGLEPRGATTLAEVVHTVLPRLRKNAPVVVVSPLVGDPTVDEAITTLMGRGTRVFAYVPPAELDAAWGPAAEAWLGAQARAVAHLRGLGVHMLAEDAPPPKADGVAVAEVAA
jgi:uncharacterized protein (DUF58 family)